MLDEPVIVDLVLRNVTAQSVRVPVDDEAVPHYRVKVTGPNGIRAVAFAAANSVSFGQGYSATMRAGESHNQPMILSRWFPFQEEGHYSVAVFLPEATEPALIEVDVGPPDVHKIQTVCEDLAVLARGPREKFALTALSTIRNACAVKHVRAHTPPMLAILTLAAMDSVDAVQALTEFAHSPDEILAEYAQAALSRRRNSTKSDAVRQELERSSYEDTTH
jgi:hypothetical protein